MGRAKIDIQEKNTGGYTTVELTDGWIEDEFHTMAAISVTHHWLKDAGLSMNSYDVINAVVGKDTDDPYYYVELGDADFERTKTVLTGEGVAVVVEVGNGGKEISFKPARSDNEWIEHEARVVDDRNGYVRFEFTVHDCQV